MKYTLHICWKIFLNHFCLLQSSVMNIKNNFHKLHLWRHSCCVEIWRWFQHEKIFKTFVIQKHRKLLRVCMPEFTLNFELLISTNTQRNVHKNKQLNLFFFLYYQVTICIVYCDYLATWQINKLAYTYCCCSVDTNYCSKILYENFFSRYLIMFINIVSIPM